MDNFNVPKKVNRHVLKALNILSSGNCKEPITMARICTQVKFQMRNLVPVPDLDYAIQKSLKNLSEVGVIVRQGNARYCLGRNYAPPPASNPNQSQPDRRIFRMHENKRKSRSALDPNLKRNCDSDDSLSGDDFDKARKRMRSNNKQLRHAGRTTILPRARQHKYSMKMFDAHPSFVTNSTSSSNIEEEVSNVKTSADEFMEENISPVPSLEATDISEEAVKKCSEITALPIQDKLDDVMIDAPKLELQKNSSSIVRHQSSRTSGTDIGVILSKQKVENEVIASTSQASAHSHHKTKETPGRLDLAFSYMN